MAASGSDDDAIPGGGSNTLQCRFDDVRIREHLRRTERDLRQIDHPELSPDQRRRRRISLDRLRDYWQRGTFPRNRSRTSRTPCFIGASDVPCAMAYLLLEDGRDDLVDAVVETDPTIHLETVEDGPLVEWIEANGLTMEEAARIQPSYPHVVHFATDCGPVACRIAWAVATVIGLSVAAGLEYVGYRFVSDAFPDNALKRRATLGYLTVLNLFVVPLVALLAFALFP